VNAPLKLYRGTRTTFGAIVTVNGETLGPAPSQAVRYHADGYAWGQSHTGSAALQLALAVLLDCTGDAELAREEYQDFARQWVAQWGDQWQVTGEEIRHWLSLSKTHAGESQ
jgi:hypothetical protein